MSRQVAEHADVRRQVVCAARQYAPVSGLCRVVCARVVAEHASILTHTVSDVTHPTRCEFSDDMTKLTHRLYSTN
jgi:hypothetical protein